MLYCRTVAGMMNKWLVSFMLAGNYTSFGHIYELHSHVLGCVAAAAPHRDADLPSFFSELRP